MSSAKDYAAKTVRRLRRRRHCRRKTFGTAEKPRLTVFRSHKNIYCQLIDDMNGVTLASASTKHKDAQIEGFAGNKNDATSVGKAIAEKAVALGISSVQFDRNGYKFHGRVKALADAAREGGLKF